MGSLCQGRYGWFQRKFETDTRWRQQTTNHFRPNRRAFDVARRCHGARTAAQLGARFDRDRTDAERVAAAIFSWTIREYSAGEHFPRAIICPRRPIVSQDAIAISIIIKGTEVGFRRIRFFIAQSMVERGRRASHEPRSAHHPTPLLRHWRTCRSGYAFGDRYSAALIDVLAVDGRVSVDGCISILPTDPSMPLMSLLLISISLLISLK